MKIINGYVWLLVTDKAKEVFNSEVFDVYVLYDDGSESLCERESDIDNARAVGLDLAIEVGHLPK